MSVSDVLDTIINQAEESRFQINYIALSPEMMKNLVNEVVMIKNVEVQGISGYKDVKLVVKDIIGFQVAYSTYPI